MGGAHRWYCRTMTSSAASTTYAAQLLRARTLGMPSKQLPPTAACSDHGQTTASCDQSLKTTRFYTSTTTTPQKRCAHLVLHPPALPKDLACMRRAPAADGSDWPIAGIQHLVQLLAPLPSALQMEQTR